MGMKSKRETKKRRREAILEDFLSALSLRGKAGDGPDFNFYTSVELLPSHIPYTMAWSGHCAILNTHTRTHRSPPEQTLTIITDAQEFN